MKAIERLYKYLEYKGVRPGTFEKEIGLSQGYLGKMYARKADMGEGIILRIVENCPEINLDWLLTGNGPMLRDERPAQAPVAAPPPAIDPGREALYRDMLVDRDREIGRLNRELGACQQRIRDIENKNGGTPEVLGSARGAVTPTRPGINPVR